MELLRLGSAREALGKYLGSLGEYVDLDELQMIEDSGISPDDKNLAISLAAERTFFYGTEKEVGETKTEADHLLVLGCLVSSLLATQPPKTTIK